MPVSTLKSGRASWAATTSLAFALSMIASVREGRYANVARGLSTSASFLMRMTPVTLTGMPLASRRPWVSVGLLSGFANRPFSWRAYCSHLEMTVSRSEQRASYGMGFSWGWSPSSIAFLAASYSCRESSPTWRAVRARIVPSLLVTATTSSAAWGQSP